MFGRLREALRRAAEDLASGIAGKAFYRELREDDLKPLMDDLVLRLVEADVSFEAAEQLAGMVLKSLSGTRIPRTSDVRRVVEEALYKALLELLSRSEPSFDLVSEALERCGKGSPLVVVFLGVNGVGKTTTIAKVAYMLKKRGATPVIAAADTFRAGAQEQLETHARRIGVPIVKGRYGADPASVAFDAVRHAASKRLCAALIDTAGRMHVDKNLVEELRKVVRVVKPHYKILVVDSLTGNDAVEQARRFNEAVGVDGVIVAKVDADPKGGAVVSVAAAIGKPILYLGVGQGYEDLKPFKPEEVAKSILS
ncbi:MAG: signal recognition particle-docking protein FtsY [Desulfurococcales archaeon]|nr:signal recognition particle-docking protein FtsY [Desulfurococcales archaeon]